jgi:hypothetical protein
MRGAWKFYLVGVAAWFIFAGTSMAQPVPAVPLAPAPVAAAPAASGGGLWSFLIPSADQKAACKEHWCNSAIGKLVGAAMQPVAAFSGGLITDRCAIPTAAELAAPEDSAEGAAALIKADELAAKKRREDVRYLGTVDCSRWPEAETALILSLRADRNECVRFEAALALSRGCCCTPKTVAALSITVSGSNRDGFPIEKSERVRMAAAHALDHCLACLQPLNPILPVPVDDRKNDKKGTGELTQAPANGVTTAAATKPAAQPAPVQKVNFYQQVDHKTIAPLVEKARADQAQIQHNNGNKTTRTNGLFEIVTHSFTPPAVEVEGPAGYPAQTTQQYLQPYPQYREPQIIQPAVNQNRGLIPAMLGNGSRPANGAISPYNQSTITPARVRVESTTPYAPSRTPATGASNSTYIAPMSVNDILQQ